MRSIIIHYHLFKNAGTSIDSILSASFKDLWKNFDNENSGSRFSPMEFEKIIAEHPDLKAFSSHQIVPPIPNNGLRVFPIVFLRHPIDRLKSAYLFEWKKQLGLEAPKGTLQEYVLSKFEKRRANAIEEFHVMTLANKGYEGRRPSSSLTDEQLLSNAKSFIDTVPFYGIVERFDESLKRLDYFLKMEFPEFCPKVIELNVTQDRSKDIDERVSRIQAELGADLYEEVLDRNKLDLQLYSYALDNFYSIPQATP
ncbi:sulfotransferase family protein [Luminiphilus sp.]|nr:sulfotransferase family protein [Luminiphilus sp.]MDC3320491.1 sulfotransferase family protein [Luminiphilus sp.]